MPESPLLLNHVGTVHASVQFALAEASSGEFLLRHLGVVTMTGQYDWFLQRQTNAA